MTMPTRSEEGLFDVLEKILKKAKQPMDCVELYNNHLEVRERAANPNRVSDYLGNMWRKGVVLRLPAPKGEDRKTRWLYTWKGRTPQKPDLTQAMAFDPAVHTLLNKPNIHIEDDGRLVRITLPGWTLTIEHTPEADHH